MFDGELGAALVTIASDFIDLCVKLCVFERFLATGATDIDELNMIAIPYSLKAKKHSQA